MALQCEVVRRGCADITAKATPRAAVLLPTMLLTHAVWLRCSHGTRSIIWGAGWSQLNGGERAGGRTLRRTLAGLRSPWQMRLLWRYVMAVAVCCSSDRMTCERLGSSPGRKVPLTMACLRLPPLQYSCSTRGSQAFFALLAVSGIAALLGRAPAAARAGLACSPVPECTTIQVLAMLTWAAFGLDRHGRGQNGRLACAGRSVRHV